jgi:hypothetical protein
MSKVHGAQKRVAIAVVVVAMVAGAVVIGRQIAASPRGTTTTDHTQAQSTLIGTTGTPTTTTSSAVAPLTSVASKAPIIAGPSRSECLTLNMVASRSGLAYVESLISGFESETDSSVTCISAYILNMSNWSQWVHPWVVNAEPGFSSWVAQDPQVRQLILAVGMIPNQLENINNPLSWEKSCAAGDYDGYVKQLGKNLVDAGLGNSVIRLGPEMNGIWETYFVGTKKVEQKTWAKCFAAEVTSFRQVSGEHFLIDWNVNACTGDYPYANYYPGNAYVDIMGLDLYDVGCETPYSSLTFSELSSERLGLSAFEDFAAKKGKPMSLPEWGLSSIPAGDDPAYIAGIGSTVANGDFAFQTYYDQSGPNLKALPLGPNTPLSLVAYRDWFGDGGKQ